MKGLEGKVAIIGGGGGTIGRAIARRLIAEGCKVVCLDFSAEKLAELRQSFPEDVLFTAQADLAEEGEVEAAVARGIDRFGRIDFLVNAAGLVGPTTTVAEASLSEFDRLFRSNVRAGYIAMKIVLNHLQAAGRSGAIVSLASTATERIRPGRSLYAMTKRAVEAMTIAAALENSEHGIRVNCVSPGPIESEMFRSVAASGTAGASAAPPLSASPVGQPEDVAAMVCFLLSDDARHCTGHTYFVDGGAAA